MKGILLLVDDDKRVLDMMTRTLQYFGFKVMSECDSIKALATVEQCDDIAVLVCDFDMPGVNGAQLARAAKKQRPTLPVLILSGTYPPDLQPAPWDAWFVKGLHTTELVAQLQALTQSCTDDEEAKRRASEAVKNTTLSEFRLAYS